MNPAMTLTTSSKVARGEPELSKLRVAIVHHWFVQPWGGAENVIEAIARIFPQADLFALMADPRVLPPDLKRRRITTSFLQHIPGKYRWRRQLLPLYPLALEQLDLTGYDLVISSESAPAKGVITSPRTCHICYCNSPMRYVWEMYHDYKRELEGRMARAIFALSAHYLRAWDLATASRVDYFLANSRNVSNRIRKHYRREATVLHCPINFSAASVSSEFDDYYLVLGRLVEYKRIDLAIEACNRLKRRLKIVGQGRHLEALRRLAGPTVEFLGAVSDQEVHRAYARCRALLFPGEEDFGLVPVEAQSFGRPVIAYGAGGALETVNGLYPGGDFQPKASGVFFPEQSVDSLIESMHYFEAVESRFSPPLIREQIARFDEAHFRAALENFVTTKLVEFRAATSHNRRSIDFAMVEQA